MLVSGRSRLGARSSAGYRPWKSGIAEHDGRVYWVESGATPLRPGAKVPSVNIQQGSNNTTSNNASYRIEITKWDVKPCPTDNEPTHEGGLASGRILVKVPSENTEVSGTFTDAVVRYGQTPDWAYR